MRIGLDFDNTIVNYDPLFHKVALEQNLIDSSIPINKIAVRNFLREQNKETLWTEMQGFVYGARMQEAQAFPQAIAVINKLQQQGHTLAIISHKTRYPYMGVQYDLHQSASRWIEKFLRVNDEMLISKENIFFELTKEAKLARIKQFQCDLFLDDLPEILGAPQFPETTRRILFDPEQQHAKNTWKNIQVISSWQGLENYV